MFEPVVIIFNTNPVTGADNPILQTKGGYTKGKILTTTNGDKIPVRCYFYDVPPGATTGPNVRMDESAVAFSWVGKVKPGLDAAPYVLEVPVGGFDEGVEGAEEAPVYYYDAILNLNTNQLNAAFGASLTNLSIKCDIQCVALSGEAREFTIQFYMPVRRQVNIGGTPPTDAVPPYPTSPQANKLLGGNAAGNAWVFYSFGDITAGATVAVAGEAALAALVRPVNAVQLVYTGTGAGLDLNTSRWILVVNDFGGVTTAGTYVISTGVPGHIWVAV